MCGALIVRKVVVLNSIFFFGIYPFILYQISLLTTRRKLLRENVVVVVVDWKEMKTRNKEKERFLSRSRQVKYITRHTSLLCSWQSHSAAADHVEWNIGQIFSHSIISFLISHQNQIQKEGLLKKTPK